MMYRPPSYFAEKTGFSARWIQERAKRGEIPGTIKAGSHYRIDVQKFWHWWRAQEVRKWQVSIKEERSGGGAVERAAKSSGSRLRQILNM